LSFYKVSFFTRKKFISFIKLIVKCEWKMLNERNQIHNLKSSSCSGTVINYSSGSASQKVMVPTVPVPHSCPVLLTLIVHLCVQGWGHETRTQATKQGIASATEKQTCKKRLNKILWCLPNSVYFLKGENYIFTNVLCKKIFKIQIIFSPVARSSRCANCL
jgi:hypothetical protein